MAFSIAGSVIMIVIGLWNTMIGILGLFSKFHTEAIGTLAKAETSRNTRSRHGYLIPVYVRYADAYTVNGRKYRYSSEGAHSKRRLLPKAVMVYVKWFSRHAYPYKSKGTKEWVLGICFLVLGLMNTYLTISEGVLPG